MTNYYYRVLYSQEHYQAWQEKQFNSYHHYVPGEWIEIYTRTQSRNPDDYDLSIDDDGTYTAKALKSFLNYYPPLGNPTKQEIKSMSELAGVCAFRTMESAFSWGINKNEQIMKMTSIVEFKGEFICEAPEDFGVVAKVTEVTKNPIPILKFGLVHGLITEK